MSNFFKAEIELVFGRQRRNKAFNSIAESVKNERDAQINFILLKKVEELIGRIPTALEIDKCYSVELEGIRRYHKWSGVTLFTVVNAEDL